MLLFSFAAASFNGVPFSQYIRVALPFFLCWTSMILASLWSKCGFNIEYFFKPLILTVILSSFWTPFYYLVIADNALDVLRHQLLGPLVPLVFSFSICFLLAGKKYSKYAIGLFVFGISLIALSVTRSYLLVPVVVLFFSFAALNSKSRAIVVSRIISNSKYMIALLFFMVPVIGFLKSDVFDFWQYRLFGLVGDFGFDPTTYTRIAEYSAQYEIVTSDPIKIIIGAGFGAEYYWSSDYFYELSQILPLWYLEELRPWEAGHSTWIYSFFSLGILVGFLLPIVYFLSLFTSFKNISSTQLEASKEYLFFNVSLISFFILTISANPFGPRISGLVMGVIMIVPFLLSKLRKNSR